MSWRHAEMGAFGTDVVPLDRLQANAVYSRAIGLCSRTRYGLNETLFHAIERQDVDKPARAVRPWLALRVESGDLLLVFGQEEVFQVRAAFFLDHWQDLFTPSRDDVIIVPVDSSWILFYSHEDEFEFSRT